MSVATMASGRTVEFYSPDQERDSNGRWGSGGNEAQRFQDARNTGHGDYGPKWAHEYIEKQFINQSPLSMDEKSALGAYNTNEGYNAMNQALRSGGSAGEYDQDIQAMDQAMETHALTQDTALYRGVGAGVFSGDPQSLVGTTFEDKAFVSTSAQVETANKFTNPEEGYRMEILAPSGTHGLYGPTLRGKDPYNEREFTLPRGTQFKIVGVGTGTTNFGEPLRTIQAVIVR